MGTCDTLSRLKGIETYHVNHNLIQHELTCDTLSRLKGIETLLASVRD